MEAEISAAILTFEKEYMGRGPENIRVLVVGDMIIVREQGVLTPAETQLAKTNEGVQLVKRVRIELIENARRLLLSLVQQVTGFEVAALHTDISTSVGERIIVFTLNGDLEAALGKVRMLPQAAGQDKKSFA